MEVIDIDKKIAKKKDEMGDSKPIIIEIQDSERIKTIHVIAPDLMEAFGIVERNSHTITQLEPEADEDDEDDDDSEQDMQYDENDEDPVDAKQKVHYYAFEKDCCCGLLRLSEKPLIYLYIKPRFPLDICSMLEKVDKFHPLWEKCLRKPEIDLVYEGVPEEYRKKLWDSEGKGLGTKSKGTPCCAVSMSVLFELYAWTMIKKTYYCGTGWHVVDNNAKLMPDSTEEFYIVNKEKPELIPDIVLEKDGKYIILDVKYKDCDVPNRDDRLQLLTYADVYDAHVIGHIFPGKGNFRSGKLNTKLGDHYHYLQFCLDDSGKVSPELIDKIKKVIEGAGLM